MPNLALLKTLQVNKNMIQTLPLFLGQLPRLEVLELCINKLTATSFPTAWETDAEVFPKLRVLKLAYNRLELVPAWLAGRALLEKLDLSNNIIEQIPEELYDAEVRVNLRCLDLSYNDLNSVPPRLGLLNLSHLSLEGRMHLRQLCYKVLISCRQQDQVHSTCSFSKRNRGGA